SFPDTTLFRSLIILFAMDRDGVVTLSEGAALSALGLAPGETVGRSVFELYRDVPELLAVARRVLRGETVTNTLALGSAVLESWLAPLRGPSGEVAGIIGVSTDITERQRLEKQVAQTERLSAL